MKHWSLTTLREKLTDISAKVVSHSRYVVLQMAEVAVPRTLFREILGHIAQLRASSELARAGCPSLSEETRFGDEETGVEVYRRS